MRDCGRGWQRIDGEREDRKVRIINNIQKSGPALSLPARKNPSIPPGGFGFLGLAGANTGFTKLSSFKAVSDIGFWFF